MKYAGYEIKHFSDAPFVVKVEFKDEDGKSFYYDQDVKKVIAEDGEEVLLLDEHALFWDDFIAEKLSQLVS